MFAKQPGETVKVFEDVNGSKVVGEIDDDSPVLLLKEEKGKDYSLILYKEEKETDPEEIQGYAPSDNLIPEEEAEEVRNSRQLNEMPDDSIQEDVPLNEKSSNQQTEEEAIETDVTEKGPKVDEEAELEQEFPDENSQSNQTSKEATEEVSQFEKAGTVDEAELEEHADVSKEITEPSPQIRSFATFSAAQAPESFQGIALKNRTNVYDFDNHSKVLKSYKQGHILKFHTHPNNDNLYAAIVYVNGERQDGIIHKSDVDLLVDGKSLQGYAAVQPVHVYQGPSRDSAVLKSYNVGSPLKYQAFSIMWHKATVYVKGKRLSGYIYSGDVMSKKPSAEHPSPNGPTLRGVAKQSPTAVYSSQSTTSKKLKTYPKGHILKYKALNSNWHIATVYINGKAQTGYLHVSHVDTADTSSSRLKGIAIKSPTRVYSKASTSSSTLKSYSQGHVLSYRNFTKEWFEATVYVSGKPRTGYIHKNHVENAGKKHKTIKGAAMKSSTHVYSKASRGSKILKSYKFGHGLIYRTFTSDWYEATVYVNGKKYTGYIHKSDVTSLAGKKIVLDPGHGGYDSGARASGLIEKKLNLDIALRAEKLLRNAGASVVMTRKTDSYISLPARSQIANSSGADIFISIHGNAFNGTAQGVETFWYGKYQKQNSIRLAHSLQDSLVSKLDLRYRRVAEGNFHVIRETKIPSALVEVGFLDHPVDAAKLKKSYYRDRAAEGILLGVIDYF
ncbi:N-acetylmuramoyl-L-alanine amidase [Siminovitchia sediminis]|uniref:N-acetylmuramoyl-L-alanine amidase n=1 Tax=Siminovitchia sediminis TaxID=1274353 RepID=A0ABW4KJY7_9BACI